MRIFASKLYQRIGLFFVAIVLSVMSVNVVLPSKASAFNVDAYYFFASPDADEIEIYTGSVTIPVKVNMFNIEGIPSITVGPMPASITATVTGGEVATDCSSFTGLSTATKDFNPGDKAETSFCYRSDDFGLQTVNFTSTFPTYLFGDNAPSASVNINVKDSVMPIAPVLVSPENKAVINGASITQSWSTTDTDIEHYVYESYNDEALTDLKSTSSPIVNSEVALNVSDSVYWWRVQAVDFGGNVSPWSEVRQVNVDNTAPIVQINSPIDGSILKGNVEINGTISDSNLWQYYVRIEDSLKTIIYENVVYSTEFTDQVLYNWDTSLVTDGEYTIYLEARDQAQNKDGDRDTLGNSVKKVVVTVDNTAPVIKFISEFVDGNKFTPTLSISDNISDSDDINFEWEASSTNPSGAIFDNTLLSPTFTVKNNGTYNFTLTITDEAGNTSEYTYTFTYKAPVIIPIITPIFVEPEDDNVITYYNEAQGQVLGENTESNTSINGDEGSTDVKGDSTKKESKEWNILGLTWYWWLLIISSIGLIWWLIAAYRRRKNEDA